MLCVWYGLTWVFGGSKLGKAQAASAAEEPAIIRTVAPLETPTLQPSNPPTFQPSNLEPAQLAATAQMQAAINRPAAVDPAGSPYLVGVVTYETGCPLSNLGFTTSGANGTPYYLYLSSMLDRDPYSVRYFVG
ncbi:MAG: hypothetical protein HC875_17030 [Anaerolineales bacterium]|nr:hypothetical protein [Anaerolineales bacterium]